MSSSPSGSSHRIGRRARHARRVGPEHVGERVSIRRWIDDPERGPVQSDVVGRLLAHDGEALLVIDRREHLHVVDATRIVSSRVVPPHPKMADEPTRLGSSREEPVERQAARVLLLDRADRILLIAHDPGSGSRPVWTAPGGGLEPGEDHAGAAQREVREELGVDVAPRDWVWSRTATFGFRGIWLRQHERWFLARLELDPATAPLDDVGISAARWWTIEELEATSEPVAPRALAASLRDLLDAGPPPAPIDVGV